MRKILVAIVALMASLSAFAADLDLFLKGGASISKFNLDDSENRTGVAASFGSKFHITDSNFFIMTQAMYAQKGQDGGVSLKDGKVTIRPVQYHMIEIPVQFGGQFDLPVSDMNIAVAAGPYISYDYRFHEVGENMKYVSYNTSNNKGLSHGDLGVALSLEVHYKRLFVFYDYDLGLRDITQGTLGSDVTVRHRSMRMGAGYSFPTMTLTKKRKKPQM